MKADNRVKFGQSRAMAIIHVDIKHVDLANWLFTLTTQEYEACAKGHQGATMAQLFDHTSMAINVETIGNAHMVQHYIARQKKRDYVLAVSPNTQIWFKNGARYSIEVHWEMTVMSITENSCQLTCQVTLFASDEAFLSLLKDPVVSASADLHFNAHIEEETPLFAKNIESKAKARIWG